MMTVTVFGAQLSLFFSWLVRTSVQASILICLILAAQLALRRVLAPRWRYWLWLLLLARLAMVWAPQSSLSVFNLIPSWQERSSHLVSGTPPGSATPEQVLSSRDEVSPAATGATAEPTTVTPDARNAGFSLRELFRQTSFPFGLISLLWLLGVLVFSGYALSENVSLLTRVKRERPLTDQKVLDLLEDCKATMKIHAPMAVIETPKVKSPSLFGFVRPRLLLPEGTIETMSPGELRFVFLHEMAHLKCYDIVINWVATVLQVIHWFNPLVWYAFYRMRADCELACDAMVLSHSEQSESQEYGRTILNLLERFSQPARVPGMAGILEDKSQLKRRIASIAVFKRDSYQWSAVAVTLLAILAFVTLTDARTTRPEQTPVETPDTKLSPTPSVAGPVTQEKSVGSVVQDGKENMTASEHVAKTDEPVQTAAAAPTSSVAETSSEPAPPPAQARPEIGVALVEFSRIGSKETLGEASAQMYELVAARLANEHGVRLVEREKLEKAFQELKLSQTGLVDPATAMQLGKITGARVFIVGKLMKLESNWVVTARLIDAQTSEAAGIRVTGAESKGLITLADATSAKIVEQLHAFAKTMAQPGEKSPFGAEIERVRQSLAQKELPRVTVCVPESHLGTWVPDPAGENEIIAILSRVGYHVVDISTFMKRQPARWWLTIFHGRAQEGDGREIRITEMFRSAADIMHDKRLEKMKDNADIFVVGEAFSEFVGDNYGFKSCRARIEVKAIDTATEEIAIAGSDHAAAADVGEFIAGKKALKNAGGMLGVQIAKDLAGYWEKKRQDTGHGIRGETKQADERR